MLNVKFSYKESTVWNCCRNIGHFHFCIRQFALHRQQPAKDEQNVDFALPWKNFCGRPCMQLLLRVYSDVRRKFSWRAFIQWHMVVVCISCALFVTSQFRRHIHVSKPTFWRSLMTKYTYSSTRTLLRLCVVALNANYQRSKRVKHTHH